jgi:hypothetical protein
MNGGRARFRLVAVFLFGLAMLSGLRAQAPLTIRTSKLGPVAAGSSVRLAVHVTGGNPPLTWKVLGGKLPPGLKLNPKTGVIAGRPTAPGVFHFGVLVIDSGAPAMQIQREFTLVVTAALNIQWKQPPAVHGEKIEGSLIASNLTQQDVALTVIVMAVNEIGRATALGYQEFTLRSGVEQVIPFGASPGPGRYVVHADAVGEVASTHTIHRARRQSEKPLVILATP